MSEQFRLQAELSLAQSPAQTPAAGLLSWSQFWGDVWLSALVLGGAIWYIGGFWYGIRARWCGYSGANIHTPRLIYIYSAAISALPHALLLVGQTFAYPNFQAAHIDTNEAVLSATMTTLAIFGVWVSYTGARKMLRLDETRARWWFLILPLCIQALAVIAIFKYGGTESSVV